MNTRSTVLGLALAALAACAPVDDAPAPVGAQSIRDGNLATAFQRARVARVSGCTATIIGPRHLLTAARCQARVGDVARFYGGTSTELLAGVSREVDRVTLPSGIVTSTGDYLDSSNDFADLVVLRLSADVPGTSRPATLSWRYPGALANGFKVGAGRHNETANPAGVLLLKDDFTWTASDSGGFFNTHSEDTDAGDGGGPFFRNGGQTSGQVFGVLHGDVSDGFGCGIFPIATCNRYSSVPRHLDFILDAAAYVGPFSTSQSGGRPLSDMGTFVTGSPKVCAYACEHTNNCRAFSWVPFEFRAGAGVPPTCYLREASEGVVTALPGAVTGVRQ